MEIALAALAVVAIAAAAAAWWSLRDRARAVSERDVARAERDHALARAAEFDESARALRAQADQLRADLTESSSALAALGAQLEERTIAATRRENELEQRFRSLAQDIMLGATRQLKQDAAADIEERKKAVEGLVKPIAETLRKTDEKIAALEKERAAADAAMREQVRALM